MKNQNDIIGIIVAVLIAAIGIGVIFATKPADKPKETVSPIETQDVETPAMSVKLTNTLPGGGNSASGGGSGMGNPMGGMFGPGGPGGMRGGPMGPMGPGGMGGPGGMRGGPMAPMGPGGMGGSGAPGGMSTMGGGGKEGEAK